MYLLLDSSWLCVRVCQVLLRSRAIENQCYVIAAAQVGQHHAKRASYGHAMVRMDLTEKLHPRKIILPIEVMIVEKTAHVLIVRDLTKSNQQIIITAM